MILVVSMQDNREIELLSNPTQRVSKDGGTVHNVTFRLKEDLGLKEGEVLHGHLIWKSEDGFVMRDYYVRDFLRYEYSKTEWSEECEKQYQEKYGDLPEERQPIKPDNNSYTLTLTTAELPQPTEPGLEPEPPSQEQQLAWAKEGREERCLQKSQECIEMGIDVNTEFGVEHFSLRTEDKIMLLGIYSMVQGGMTSFPYHSVSANTSNPCTVYTDADIAKIATGAFAYITWHESYANMLTQWINRETDPEVMQTIEYGVDLPEDLAGYMMMVMFSAMANIDPENLPVNMPTTGSDIVLPPDPNAPQYPDVPAEPLEPGTVLDNGWIVGEDGVPYDPNARLANEIPSEHTTIKEFVDKDLDPEEPEPEPTVVGPVVREDPPEEPEKTEVEKWLEEQAALAEAEAKEEE